MRHILCFARAYFLCYNIDNEAPDAYKKMEDILPAIKDTVDVVERIMPVYNFEAKK